MSKQRLQTAKKLIQEGRYKAARTVLRLATCLDHNAVPQPGF